MNTKLFAALLAIMAIVASCSSLAQETEPHKHDYKYIYPDLAEYHDDKDNAALDSVYAGIIPFGPEDYEEELRRNMEDPPTKPPCIIGIYCADD
jgi:hypothetical protein